jgi:hypothetical protein
MAAPTPSIHVFLGRPLFLLSPSRELNSIQLICISIIHCLCLINSSKLDVGIIASVCCLPNSPSSLKFELRPSWNNIHDTFPTGTAQDTTLYQ